MAVFATKTVAQLETDVRLLWNQKDAGDSSRDSNEVLAYLNWAAEQVVDEAGIAIKGPTALDMSTLDTEDELALPADCVLVQKIVLNGVKLELVDWKAKETWPETINRTPRGLQYGYWVRGRNVGFTPRPADADTCKLYYVGTIEKLGSNSTPDVLFIFNRAIVLKTLELLERSVNRDEQQATTWERLYDKEMLKARSKWNAGQLPEITSIQEVC